MAWVDILTHQEALRTPAVKISGPEKKDFEVCLCVCGYAILTPILFITSLNLNLFLL